MGVPRVFASETLILPLSPFFLFLHLFFFPSPTIEIRALTV
jgi:hypothetical protein